MNLSSLAVVYSEQKKYILSIAKSPVHGRRVLRPAFVSVVAYGPVNRRVVLRKVFVVVD